MSLILQIHRGPSLGSVSIHWCRPEVDMHQFLLEMLDQIFIFKRVLVSGGCIGDDLRRTRSTLVHFGSQISKFRLS